MSNVKLKKKKFNSEQDNRFNKINAYAKITYRVKKYLNLIQLHKIILHKIYT